MTYPIETFATYPSLRDRVVVVTGGASGIGEKIVEAFAHQQAKVSFLDISDDAAKNLIDKIKRQGGAIPTYYHCDVTDIPALRDCAQSIIEIHKTVDILVNNAGNDTRHAIEEVTPEYWDHSIAVNLKHYFFFAQAIIPAMKSANRGSIINVSSISWLIPSTGLPAYVAAKAAIVGLTRTLAHELGSDNIRVNAVLPGAIETERQRQLWYTEAYKQKILDNQALKKHIQPEAVARLVLFLAADDSSDISNQSYAVDGGWI